MFSQNVYCTLKVGCKTLWDTGNEPGVPKCTTAEHYRSKNILLSDVCVPSGIYVFALLFSRDISLDAFYILLYTFQEL